MLDQLLGLDKDLFLFLNNQGSETWDRFWMFYTHKFNWIPFYAFLLLLVYRYTGKRKFIIFIVMAMAMIVFTDQVTNAFKYGFERFRPCHEESLQGIMRIVKEGCGGRFGFFSGHSSNSMAVAVFVGAILKPKYSYLIFALFLWSFAMAYSRIYIGVHYPLDTICGMLFGALSGFGFYKLNTCLIKCDVKRTNT